MTNVRKNFQNYELDELFHLQSGIIELLNLATIGAPEPSDEGWTNIYFVTSFLQDLQKEITFRIPKDLLTK